MNFGAVLGSQAIQQLDRHAARNSRILRRQRKLAREAEINRKRSRGEIIRYHHEDQ